MHEKFGGGLANLAGVMWRIPLMYFIFDSIIVYMFLIIKTAHNI